MDHSPCSSKSHIFKKLQKILCYISIQQHLLKLKTDNWDFIEIKAFAIQPEKVYHRLGEMIPSYMSAFLGSVFKVYFKIL